MVAKTEAEMAEILDREFEPGEIKWRNQGRPGSQREVAYVDARAVIARLDEACGKFGWADTYRTGPSGGTICAISILVPDPDPNAILPIWVTKEDGAENTAIEPVKGGISDAFRRAAVKWGIGRHLYTIKPRNITGAQQGQARVAQQQSAASSGGANHPVGWYGMVGGILMIQCPDHGLRKGTEWDKNQSVKCATKDQATDTWCAFKTAKGEQLAQQPQGLSARLQVTQDQGEPEYADYDQDPNEEDLPFE